MYYFPKEVWRLIFEYDNTYREKYDEVMMELEYGFFVIKFVIYLEELNDILQMFDEYEVIDWGV